MNKSARRSKLFLGMAVIQVLFLAETVVAHHQLPNPASPLVWSVLGCGAVACIGLAIWFHVKARSE